MASRSDLTEKRVLVTGASGFTGRYMVAELRSLGAYVIALGGHGSSDGADLVLPADLRDSDAVDQAVEAARADYVIHLAALAFVGHGKAEDFYSVNLLGTRNLLSAVERASHSPSRVLLASSANVYGNSSEGVLTELSAAAPANDYAVSKLAMEYVAALWGQRLPITIVRPFNYTGVGQAAQFLVPKIVSHFARRADVMELGNIDVSRDFSDVRGVVSAYSKLLLAPSAEGQTVNVCSGRGHTLSQIISYCAEVTGHDLDVVVNPTFVRPNEVKVLLGDNARLLSLIGDWSCPTLEQTLKWMLEASAHQ